MSNRKSDSEYVAKHDDKNQAKSFLLKFYLNDEREKKLYELLQNQENKKQFILDLMENYNLR